MSDFEFTDDMGEISGFGGSYEEACRSMVVAGAEWLDENPEADIEWSEFEGVMGVAIPENGDAEDLQRVMSEAAEEVGDEPPSGAMMHAATRHVAHVSVHGWDSYVETMEGG